MQPKAQIYKQFAEDWGEDSPQFSVCVDIFEYLLSRPSEQLQHLTHGSLRAAIGSSDNDFCILRAAQYLCGDKLPMLTPHFEYVDEDDQFLPIESNEVNNAIHSGKIVHPETGEYVEDFENNIVMYFSLGPMIKEVNT